MGRGGGVAGPRLLRGLLLCCFPTFMFGCFVQAQSNYKSSDLDRLCRPCLSFTVNGGRRNLPYILMLLHIEAGSV